ncbi:MAG TPA: D-alanine--D-alanine ligase family protein [Elusimicrobiota bacterium]|nr:D-alanine--D-alanine ligase family protein [Elusimicrobiota bacterium]
MSPRRPTVLVLCGGRSAERFVSTVSARCVVENLDPRRFRVRLVHIGVDGSWAEIAPRRLLAETAETLHKGAPTARRLRAASRKLDPWKLLGSLGPEGCVFPVLHGPMGEDGTLQGMLELAGVPYVGCGVLGSAAGMDKEATKRIAASAGLPQVPWAVARTPREAAAAAKRLGFPVFVKPARMGSSVGVVKVKRASGLAAALREALRYDDKALIEKGIPAREIETAVLGDPWAPAGDRLALKASIVAEIAPNAEFYDYNAKYLDPNGARALVPAPIPAKASARVRELALAAFRALDLYGLARVDFFMHKKTGAIYFNEPNTLPGFTPVSMYPTLWRQSGVPTRRLVETLVALAYRRTRAKRRLSADPFL